MSVLCGEGSHAEPLDLCMIRYLRANKWDEVKAKTQLEENIKWRTERDVRGLELSHPATVLGCTPQEMETLVAKHYPHWHLGADRLGRPVFLYVSSSLLSSHRLPLTQLPTNLILCRCGADPTHPAPYVSFRYGSFHTNELLKVTTLNNLVDYHIWEMEHHHKLLGKYSEDAGHIVDTCTLILDFGGMELGQVTGDFIKILRQMAETDGKHYPGRAGSTFVINAPPLFHMIWGTIKGFMERDGVVVEVYGNPGQWRDKLAKQIDPRELPPYLGGTGRALQDTPFMCRYYHPTGWGGEADAAAAAEEEEGDETDSPRRLPSPNFMEAALSKFDAFTSKEFASLAEVRRIAANKLGGRGEKFVKLFFPDAGISPNAQLTEGSSSRGLERKASLSDKIESLFFPPSPS
ncbi:unnamed protein product [Chrysoparadoxa australica]